ncbi:MAG: TetR/AcrR family transcriptional regulator [Paracoccaceae bacterium]
MSAKQSYHHGDLRAALVDATRVLVEGKGPDHFSVSEAARAAGVSTTAPYKHFKDREGMLMAVVLDGLDRKQKKLQEALAAYPDPCQARIETLGRVYIDFAVNEPGVFRLIFGLSEGHDQDEEIALRGQKMFEMVQSEVAAFLGCDPNTEDARDRAMMLWSFVHGLSFLLIDGKVSSMGLEPDIDGMLREIGWRVMVAEPGKLRDKSIG